jgi:aryl-alcohol dehydrogenase-like predicted oxidoreductase
MKSDSGRSSRREFMQLGVAGILGAAAVPAVLRNGEKEKKNPASGEHKLIFRTLGNTGIRLPIVSMGCGATSEPGVVGAALDAGIVHLDTAYTYQSGRNEEMIGTVIKGRRRDSFVVATKLFAEEDVRTGVVRKNISPDRLMQNLETSLGRLGLDYVDILYYHDVVQGESLAADSFLSIFQKLKKDEKTRFIGVSTHRNEPEVIRAAADCGVLDVVLTAYNFRQPHRDEVREAIAYAARAGLGVIAMKTQAGVYWDRERQHRINMKAALKWVLQDENVHTAIPGIASLEQLEENMSVMAEPALTDREKSDLKLGMRLDFPGLYCRQCGSCLDQCPADLDIPALMRCYMYNYGYRNPAMAREVIDRLDLTELACERCSTCRVSCSMGFDVRDRVLDIARLRGVPWDFIG